MSMCSQSAPAEMVELQAAPREAKSAERMDGAMRGEGAMVAGFEGIDVVNGCVVCVVGVKRMCKEL